MNVAVMIIFGILGAGLGSFACCQAWRIRKNDKSPRSHCMHCKYQLKWYDNIPIISWLMLGGKCRKCHKKIGAAELVAEVLMATVFMMSYAFWPWKAELYAGDVLEIIKMIIFLIVMVLFMVLAVYDAKWKELPTALLIAGCVGGVIFFGCTLIDDILFGRFEWQNLLGLAGAMVILPGFYYFMYKVSKEKWVGSGDAILCVPLALMLGDFWLAMFALFASNMIGSVVMVPVLAVRGQKGTHIPFGPFLIIGFLTVFFLRDFFLGIVSI